MRDVQRHRFLDRSTPPHLVTLIMLAAIPALSMTLFLPSLPNMTEYFATDYRVMQLSVAIYLLVNAVLQVIVGPISDYWGRRIVVLWAIVLFLIASLGCMLSPNVEVFLFFRMCQAVIVAGMVLSRSIVRDMYQMNRAASVIGYVTMGMAVAPMLGPMIGGALDDAFGWKASFSLFLVIGAFLFAVCYFDLGETYPGKARSFRDQVREYPELFSSRRFWGFCLITTFCSGAFFAYLGGAPFVGTNHYGMSASLLGFYFGTVAFGYMAGNFLSGQFSQSVGTRKMVVVGAVVTALGPLGAIAAIHGGVTHPLGFFGFIMLLGVGNGLVIPNATAGMLSVRPHLAGTASGIGGAITIGLGSGLSALAGASLTEGSGPYPLVYIMLASVLAGLVCTIYVMRVEYRSAKKNQRSG
ncbi:MAG: multidrug effflux MFS transporter [Rhodobacteraceae bacterium]|nr:multidrug effflux MFS transporter [Paracoccaceae bacterium]